MKFEGKTRRESKPMHFDAKSNIYKVLTCAHELVGHHEFTLITGILALSYRDDTRISLLVE